MTLQIDNTKEMLTTITQKWKGLAQKKQNSNYDGVQYILLNALIRSYLIESEQPYFEVLGKRTLQRLMAAYPPITKSTKIKSGRKPYDTLANLLYRCALSAPHCEEILGLQMTPQMRDNLKRFALWCRQEILANKVK